MPNKIIENKGFLSIRIDDVLVQNEKHFVSPYKRPDGTESYFGSFKFLSPKDAKTTLQQAVKQLGAEDTVFNGAYPKWVEDSYGISLKVNNRVKFYTAIGSSDLVPDDQIRDFVYSIELQVSKTKENKTYLKVVRAIVIGNAQEPFSDDLYADDNSPF
jgi:hypothetical protein